jgi:hypothetical protein
MFKAVEFEFGIFATQPQELCEDKRVRDWFDSKNLFWKIPDEKVERAVGKIIKLRFVK